MRYFKLPYTDISVSAMSMGTWGFSGAKTWGESDDELSIRTIHSAMDFGINLFDSAVRYGDGKAEEVLGRAISDRREKALVATKVYMDFLTYDGVISQCEGSLKRLATDYIDIYQIHWPNREIPADETMRAFEDLKAAGKIREIAVCNHGAEALKGVRGHKIALNQLPYSLIWRLIEREAAPESEKNGIAIWAYSPLAQGLLAGSYTSVDEVPLHRRSTRFYDSKWGQGRHDDAGFETIVFDFINKLHAVCKRTGYSMPVLSLAFLQSRPNVGSVLVGSRNPEQLEQNVKAFETEVPADIIAEITALSAELIPQMGTNADMWENQNGGRMF